VTNTTKEISVRPYAPADREVVVPLLASTLEWSEDVDRDEFFAWKHLDNPFGTSPAWVATAQDRVVGYRAFMRWEFDSPEGVRRAVRAVDTATDPEFQRLGIFSRLTLQGIESLQEEGVGFVFNTPNDRSRPGYLKMGWSTLGRVPIALRPRSPLTLLPMARGKVPAELWSIPTAAGLPAAEVLADEPSVERLLDSQPAVRGLRTRRSSAYLRWRYAGFGPLHYRAVTAPDGVEGGVAFFRHRRRGDLVEATLCDVLAPGGDARVARRLARAVSRAGRVDYTASVLGDWRAGFLPVPGQGPILTWRSLCETAPQPLGDWQLSAGDVELF
jgi:hypothetical protein